MMKERKNEKDLILSDAAVCHVLKRESDALGVSLEEYVERFLMAFYEEPQRFCRAAAVSLFERAKDITYREQKRESFTVIKTVLLSLLFFSPA